ncbi:MAG: VWA domain-containing protein, partial [Acidobacteria bacterium]|nr:VWA domain-containing protein [Acidobacteriota bacterium]
QRTIAAQVSTNQGAPRGHVYVLVFDEAHIQPGREQRARLAAERFLRTRVRAGDRVALYALPGPGPQIEFTSDVARVRKALLAVRGAADQGSSGVTGGTLSSMRVDEAYEIDRGNMRVLDRVAGLASLTRAGGTDSRSTASNRGNDVDEDQASVLTAVTEDARALVNRADGDSRRFLMALADVVRTLRQVDGRKTVILFSEGFQVDHVTHELDDVAAAAAQSYSAIYAMDLNARGVEAGDDTPRGDEQTTGIRDKLQSLGSLASETAGELITDAAGQLDRTLARIAESTEDYYLVGFAPAGNQAGNRYRRIQVNVTRPGAHVSTRTGYAPNPAATPADRRRAINAAIIAPFSQQGLRVEYTTYTLRGSASDLHRIIVSLAAELPVAASDATSADVVYVVRNVETGKVAATGSDVMPLPDAPANAGATAGIGVYRVQFEVPAGEYLMRVVVREPGGLLGSADRRFQVRALNGPDVTASDLVIGSSEAAGLPVRATVYEAEMLDGVFELYGRTAAQLEAVTVTADLVPVGGGQSAVSARADLQPVKSVAGGLSRGARVELPLDGVAPGEYIVRARIRDRADTISDVLRDVTVSPGTRPAAPPRTVTARFDPLDVLGGDVARRLVETIRTRAGNTALEPASRAAAAGNWSAVDAALRSSSSGAPDESILIGMAVFAKGDYAAAIAAFNAAQDAGRHDAALLFILGWAHAAHGDDPAAITAWRNAILGDPTLVPSYLALIDSYVRLGHPELALQVVKAGLLELPRSPEFLDRLARLRGGGTQQ